MSGSVRGKTLQTHLRYLRHPEVNGAQRRFTRAFAAFMRMPVNPDWRDLNAVRGRRGAEAHGRE